MAESRTSKVTVALPADLWRQVRRHALDNDVTAGALVARYLAEGLERDDKSS